MYRLYYWPGLPGRGEYVRLVLEQAGAEWVDVARLPPEQGGGVEAVTRVLRGELKGVRPFAPPVLEHDGLVIHQTSNICRYVGLRHGLWPADPRLDPVALQLQLTIADLVNEVHETHHPVSTALYYEQQQDVAIRAAAHFREHRMFKFLSWMESVLDENGGTWMLGDALTAVDLAVFQTCEGLRYAFPRTWAKAEREHPAIVSLRDRVAAQPRIAAYLASPQRLPFNEHGIFRRYPELDEP